MRFGSRGPAVRLGYITRNALTEKAPYRDLGNRFGMFYNDIGNYKKRL